MLLHDKIYVIPISSKCQKDEDFNKALACFHLLSVSHRYAVVVL